MVASARPTKQAASQKIRIVQPLKLQRQTKSEYEDFVDSFESLN